MFHLGSTSWLYQEPLRHVDIELGAQCVYTLEDLLLMADESDSKLRQVVLCEARHRLELRHARPLEVVKVAAHLEGCQPVLH